MIKISTGCSMKCNIKIKNPEISGFQNVDKVLGKTPRIFLCDEAESQYLRDF